MHNTGGCSYDGSSTLAECRVTLRRLLACLIHIRRRHAPDKGNRQKLTFDGPLPGVFSPKLEWNAKSELPDRAGASSDTHIKISVVRRGNRKVRDTRMTMTRPLSRF